MKSLILRTCNSDMTSYEGFQWPTSGYIEAPNWDGGLVKCGGKLHGLLWGCGTGHLLNWDFDAKWLVVEVEGECVDLTPVDGSVKVGFRCGNVIHVGDQKSATDYLLAHGAADKPVVGCYKIGGNNSFLTGGDYSTLTGGYCSTLTGGNNSTLTGGNHSTLTGGYNATLTGGYNATLTGGYGSTLTGGNRSTLTGGSNTTLTGGNYSVLTGGDDSTLTGGNDSTLTGGNHSTLIGGNRSILTGGNYSTLTGGDCSTLTWKIWDGNRYRIHTFYVGENGVLPNTKYQFDNGLIIEV